MKIFKKILLISVVLFIVLCAAIYILNTNKVAVLGYHSVLPKNQNTNNGILVVNQEDFEKQISFLKKAGYHSMSLEEFYCWKSGECKKHHNSVLITFDDGFLNNYEYAFEILKKYNMKAVVFIIGSFVESNKELYLNRENIEKAKIQYPNIEFASHTYDLHVHGDKTYNQVDNDIKKMNNVINSQYFAYPFGDYTDEYIHALKDNNYKMAFTFGPGREHRKADLHDDNYEIPRLNIGGRISYIKFIARLILPL